MQFDLYEEVMAERQHAQTLGDSLSAHTLETLPQKVAAQLPTVSDLTARGQGCVALHTAQFHYLRVIYSKTDVNLKPLGATVLSEHLYLLGSFTMKD